MLPRFALQFADYRRFTLLPRMDGALVKRRNRLLAREACDARRKLAKAEAAFLTVSIRAVCFRQSMSSICLLLHLVFFSELPQLIDHLLFLHRQLLAHQLHLDLYEGLLPLLFLELVVLLLDLLQGYQLLFTYLVSPHNQILLLGCSLVLKEDLAQLNIFLLFHL